MERETQLRVCIVGSGTRFLSGISHYTNRLARELAGGNAVSVILMRQLLPTRFYPGRRRVGAPLARLDYPPTVRVLDGIDWYWIPSVVRGIAFLLRRRPDVVIFQWWTGTVLHTYLLLALVARKLCRARIVIELHEIQDTGELGIPLAGAYVRALFPVFARLADGFVVHSAFDREQLAQRYHVGGRPLEIIPHGPYDQYRRPRPGRTPAPVPSSECCELLYFGVIRPFKGVEDLIAAFDTLSEDEVGRFRLTVVGETWESWTLPAEMIERSRHRDRIAFVNRYVSDDEAASFFEQADAVVLPYRRSSASGPLHVAMSHGLPVVVTRVGGLVEAVDGYGGAVQIPPADPDAIREALPAVAALRGGSFPDPRSWEQTAVGYDRLFAQLRSTAASHVGRRRWARAS